MKIIIFLRKNYTLALLIPLLILTVKQDANSGDNISHRIDNNYDAVEMALRCTGFSNTRNFSLDTNMQSVELVVFEDSTIPFLHEKFYKKEVWEVVFTNISFNTEILPLAKDTLSRKFRVYIDPFTGKLIKLESPYWGEEKLKQFLPAPSARRAEKQLREMRLEFIDFESAIDKVDLYTAFKSLYYPNAQQITAHLIKILLRGNEYTIWSVTYRGIEPPRENKENVPDYYENYIRVEYSANTGEVMATSINPTVEPVNETNK